MKNKKIPALLLALVMSLSCLCVSALAADAMAKYNAQSGSVSYTVTGLNPEKAYLVAIYQTTDNALAYETGMRPDAQGRLSGNIILDTKYRADVQAHPDEYKLGVVLSGAIVEETNLGITQNTPSPSPTTPATPATSATSATPATPATPTTTTPAKSTISFTDVDAKAYYADAVKWAVEKGVTNGTGANTFSPNASCTRGQVVTFLWRAAGSPEPKATSTSFADLGNASAYYYKAVLWAVENKITNGTSDTAFSPNAIVNRGQVVTFLYRYEKATSTAGDSFNDVAADAYYAPAVNWAVANSITNGTGTRTFSPDSDCTRGQIVTFLYRDMVK